MPPCTNNLDRKRPRFRGRLLKWGTKVQYSLRVFACWLVQGLGVVVEQGLKQVHMMRDDHLESLANAHNTMHRDADPDENCVTHLEAQLTRAQTDAERECHVLQNELNSLRQVFKCAELMRGRCEQLRCCEAVVACLREQVTVVRGCIQHWALSTVSHGTSVLATRLDNFERQLEASRSSEREQDLHMPDDWSDSSHSPTARDMPTDGWDTPPQGAVVIGAASHAKIGCEYRNWKTRRRASIKQPTFGPFEFVKPVGVGSCGSVLLVHTADSQSVAVLKCIRRSAAATVARDAKAAQSRLNRRLAAELKALQKLNHPFIVSLKGHATTQTHLCLLLEYLPGGDLFDLLDHELSIEQVRFYAANVTSAVEHLSETKMAYRDLKPENLAIRADGYLVLIDLGLVADVSQGKSYTMCGTPEYMSPELIRGEGHDHSVDVWGLGVLIYEMATGFGPFAVSEDTSVYEVYEAVRDFKPDDLVICEEPEWDLCTQLVQELLISNPTHRLGCCEEEGGILQIKTHPFFTGLCWDSMMLGALKAPHIPLPEEPQLTPDQDKILIDVFDPNFEMELHWKCGTPISPDADFSPSSPLGLSPAFHTPGNLSPPPVL